MANPGAGQRMFITGGSGYIGSQIISFAIAEGYEVHGLSRSEKSDAKLTTLGAVPVRGSLETGDVLRHGAASADVVLHLADARSTNFQMSVEEALRIENAAVAALAEGIKGTQKLLIVTSGSLVAAADLSGKETTEASPPWPEDQAPHLRIKAEQFALSLGIKVCVIRLAACVHGRGGGGVPMFMRMALARGAIYYVGDGGSQTSYVHVDDAARMYLLAAKKAQAGDIFNCTETSDTTIRQLVEVLGEVLQLPAQSLSHDDALSKLGKFFVSFLTLTNRASSAKARQELGWETKETGILEDIRSGSYRAVANALKEGAAGKSF